jgi:hypothetical protein
MTRVKDAKLDLAVTVEAVEEWFHQRVGFECPVDVDIFRVESGKLGLHWVGLFAMAIIETGYFRSEIFRSKRNMFGLGAVDSDPAGKAAQFPTDTLAVRAGAEHLAVYAGSPAIQKWPDSNFVLKRSAKLRQWGYFGIIRDFAELGGITNDSKVKWASNANHGKQVEVLIAEIINYCKKNAHQKNPPKSAPGNAVLWKALVVALKKLQPILAKVNPWLGWIALVLYSVIEYFIGR